MANSYIKGISVFLYMFSQAQYTIPTYWLILSIKSTEA